MTERDYISVVGNVLEEMNVIGVHSEIYEEYDNVVATIEAPNFSLMDVTISIQELDKCADEDEVRAVIMSEVRNVGHSFNAYDEYEALYSEEFIKDIRATPSQLMGMLKTDEEFFHNL